MLNWLILVAGIVMNASASVLIKMAMMRTDQLPNLSSPFAVLGNWPLWSGILFYGGAFVIYALALSRLPLNVAHPILTSGAIATVAVMSVVIFREPLRWTTGFGILLVILGVILIAIRVQ